MYVMDSKRVSCGKTHVEMAMAVFAGSPQRPWILKAGIQYGLVEGSQGSYRQQILIGTIALIARQFSDAFRTDCCCVWFLFTKRIIMIGCHHMIHFCWAYDIGGTFLYQSKLMYR